MVPVPGLASGREYVTEIVPEKSCSDRGLDTAKNFLQEK